MTPLHIRVDTLRVDGVALIASVWIGLDPGTSMKVHGVNVFPSGDQWNIRPPVIRRPERGGVGSAIELPASWRPLILAAILERARACGHPV